jgi:hypothetical protein
VETAAGAKRRTRQRGNAMLEATFVLIPLLALIFGVMDFGLAIFVRTTLQHATREGVRYAITYQTADGLGHDASIRQVVRRATYGLLTEEEAEENVLIRYFDPVTFSEVGQNLPGNVIEVSVEGFTWGWMAPLLRSANPIQLTARASDRMEGLPTGSAPPAR